MNDATPRRQKSWNQSVRRATLAIRLALESKAIRSPSLTFLLLPRSPRQSDRPDTLRSALCIAQEPWPAARRGQWRHGQGDPESPWEVTACLLAMQIPVHGTAAQKSVFASTPRLVVERSQTTSLETQRVLDQIAEFVSGSQARLPGQDHPLPTDPGRRDARRSRTDLACIRRKQHSTRTCPGLSAAA